MKVILITIVSVGIIAVEGYSFFNYESSSSYTAYNHQKRYTSTSFTGNQVSSTSLVCYADLGCFNNFPPYQGQLLPQSPEDQNLAYILFTRKNPLVPQLLDSSSPETIALTNFDNSKKIFVIIHGYTNTGLDIWVRQMAVQLLAKEDANVIVVEWSKGANGLYVQAAANSRVIGASVATILDKLTSSSALLYLFNPNNIHIIGHGLGAHAAGFAGKKSPWIGRITGLDPAGPLFEDVSPWARLDSLDAQIVDVIHTDIPGNGQIGLGISKAIGSVDFYPNSGIDQPGCPPTLYSLEDFLLGKIAVTDPIACDHLRAIDYFVASINNCEFLAEPCEESLISTAPQTCVTCGRQGCARLGSNVNRFSRGTYYLITTPSFPFCVA